MNAENTQHLDDFEREYARIGKFIFCPCEGINQPIPIMRLGILKSKITIRYAWQIGENDPAGVAIYKDDDPIIPNDVKDAPVIALLKKKQGGDNNA
jgi:hypothetical protein